MCTAISFKTKNHYFGRNLDWEYSYGEEICIAPRRFPFEFSESHYAILGTAIIKDGYPLFFDGVNEKGLSMAGLSFPGNAHYKSFTEGFDNIPSYDFISFILSSCDSIEKAEILLSRINITDKSFSSLSPSPLHFMIADKERSIVVEPLKEGVKIYDNPVCVLTNNPPFNIQLHNLKDYMSLTPYEPENNFSSTLSLLPYSKGLGALGLPGDLSSSSRFARCAFMLHNSLCRDDEESSVNQFFHILQSASQIEGAVRTKEGTEKTIYTCCYNTDKGIYYYNTYDNFCINAVEMHRENLDTSSLITYPMIKSQNINIQNRKEN